MRKVSLLIAILIPAVISGYFAAPRLRAASACEFQNSLQKLSQAQENTLANDSSDNIRIELSFRKAILGQIIDCAANDAVAMQSTIKSLSVQDSDIKNIQNRFASKFDDVINYYHSQKTLVGDLGIEGSKKFSANFKEWKHSNYEPLFELGTNFIIFSKNQELMRTAENRLDQIKRTLQTLSLTDNETVRKLLQNAEDNFRKAKGANDQAQEVFRLANWPNDSSALITSSLGYLKETYQNFFDIRNETQKIISGSSH